MGGTKRCGERGGRAARGECGGEEISEIFIREDARLDERFKEKGGEILSNFPDQESICKDMSPSSPSLSSSVVSSSSCTSLLSVSTSLSPSSLRLPHITQNYFYDQYATIGASSDQSTFVELLDSM